MSSRADREEIFPFQKARSSQEYFVYFKKPQRMETGKDPRGAADRCGQKFPQAKAPESGRNQTGFPPESGGFRHFCRHI